MSPIYRPSQFPSQNPDISPATGTHELGHAGLTANVETQGWTQADVRSAHQFFQPNVDASTVAGHAALAQPATGLDQAVLAAAGANEPFSPLIQLIMRMPGQIGLLNSFFEALGSWLFPHLDLVSGIDPSLLAHEASTSSLPDVTLEHPSIDLSLLPDDAPIFQSLEDGNGILNNSVNGKLSGALERSSETLGPLNNPLKVSGQFSLGKPQYENWGQGENIDSTHSTASPGASLSQGGLNNNTASHHTWFTDKLTAPNSPAGFFNSPTVPQLPSTSSLNSSFPSLNVGASAFGQQAEALPAVAQVNINEGLASAQTTRPSLVPQTQSIDNQANFGPSGAVSDQLGAKQVMSDDVSTYRSTLGGLDNSTYDSSSLNSDYASSGTHSGHHLQGLKAKAMNLDGVKHSQHTHTSHAHNTHQGASTQQHKPVIDHIGHQSRGTIGDARYSPHRAVYDQIAHRQPYNHSHYFTPKSETTFVRSDQNTIVTQESTNATRLVSETTGESLAPTTYTIRAGDCLWNISRDHLGAALRWTEIYHMNADLLGANPNLIHPGVTIKLPSAGSELTAASKYIVKSGDNLWNISQHFTGHGERWGELYHLNSNVIGDNPRLIFPGQELTIPGIGDSNQIVAQGNDATSLGIASANTGTVPGTTQLAQTTGNQLAQATPHTQTTAEYAGSSSLEAQNQGDQLSSGTQVSAASDATLESKQQSAPDPGAAQAATPPNQANTPATGSGPKASLPANQSSVVSSSLLPDLTSFLRKK